jgi:hypothetical protein
MLIDVPAGEAEKTHIASLGGPDGVVAVLARATGREAADCRSGTDFD